MRHRHTALLAALAASTSLLAACATPADTGDGGAGGALASTSSQSSTKSSASVTSSVGTTSTTTTGTSTTSSASTTSSTSATSTVASSSSGMPMPMGDCASPTVLTLPSTVTGNTSGQPDAQTGSCENGGTGEVVFEVTAAATGTLHLTLQSSADMGLYVRTTCTDELSELGCIDDELGGSPEELFVPVTQGDVVYVVVDGYETGRESAFTLQAEAVVEVCDDQIDNDGDGGADCDDSDCSSTPGCDTGPTCTMAPGLSAVAAGDTTGGTNLFTGSCTGAGAQEKLYTYTAGASDGVLLLQLATTTDLGLYIRSTCGDDTTELACVDDSPGDEAIAIGVVAGSTSTIFVDGYAPAGPGTYSITPTFTPLTESEPNGTLATADTFSSPFHAVVFPSLDVDWVAITVPGPASTVTIATDDGGTTDCEDGNIDSEIELYGPTGTSLGFNDDISASNYCSRVVVSNLPAGTYYARAGASVQFDPNAVFIYDLTATAL